MPPLVIAAAITGGAQLAGAIAQHKSNSKALTFGREQAQNAAENAEVTRHANYDQWAARQKRINDITGRMGLSTQEIPAYVPGIMPRFTPRSVGDYLSGEPQIIGFNGQNMMQRRPVAPHPYRVGDVNSYL